MPARPGHAAGEEAHLVPAPDQHGAGEGETGAAQRSTCRGSRAGPRAQARPRSTPRAGCARAWGEAAGRGTGRCRCSPTTAGGRTVPTAPGSSRGSRALPGRGQPRLLPAIRWASPAAGTAARTWRRPRPRGRPGAARPRRPPRALASSIATDSVRSRSSPARKRGSSMSSVSGNTCFEISEVIRKTV